MGTAEWYITGLSLFMPTQFRCFDKSLFTISTAEWFLFEPLYTNILYAEVTQIMTTMTRFFQMQATWWNRLEVKASNLLEQA